MSKYTTELRFICETLAGLDESVGYNSTDEVIDTAAPLLFNFDYPIFDTDYKHILETKIIRHFYTREIGLETVGLFKLKLEAKMNEVMPYYNQLYESELLEFNPLWDVNYSTSVSQSESHSQSLSESEAFSQTESGSYSLSTSEQSSEGGSTSISTQGSEWNLFQNTPQNGLTGITDYNYLTTATNDKRNNTEQSASSGQAASRVNELKSDSREAESGRDKTIGNKTLDMKSYLEKVQGYRNNNPSKLLSDFRKTFLNIDLMIIKDLEELFFQLW